MGSTAANTARTQPIPEAGDPCVGRLLDLLPAPQPIYQHHPRHHLRPMQHPFRRCQSTSYLLRPGTFHAAGCMPPRAGTPHASGDRIPVPDGVDCPRPHRNVPGGVKCHPR